MSGPLSLPTVPDRGKRCDGCAFTPGTEANEQPLTLVKAVLSAKLCEPFYCHANLVDGKIPEGQAILCAGWDDMMQSLWQRGWYDQMSDPQRLVLSAVLQTVLKLEDRLLAGDDIEGFSVLAEVLARVPDDIAEGLRQMLAEMGAAS